MVRTGPGGGWLLEFSLSENRYGVMDPMTWTGRYRRLTFDGSVVTRAFTNDDCGEKVLEKGVEVPCRVPSTMFRDVDEEYRAWVRAGSK
jgi:hypothetical protein